MVKSPGDAVNIPRAGPRPIEQDVIHMNIGDREFKNIDQERSNVILWAKNCSENDNTNADGSGETASLFSPNGSIEGMDYSKAEKDICLNEHIGDGENISSGQGGGTLPIPSFKEETQNEPEQANNHSGTARKSQTNTNGGGGAAKVEMVDVGKICERFRHKTTKLDKLKPRVQGQYLKWFGKFVKETDFDKHSWKVLRSKGKQIVLNWLLNQPRRSILIYNSAICAVWTYGIEDRFKLPYPISPKKDLPKPPKGIRGKTPKDSAVKPWIEATSRDPNSQRRMIYDLIITLGWRPEQICKVKHRNLYYKDSGKLWGFVADGEAEDFKSKSPLIAYLHPSLRDKVVNWVKHHPGPADQPLFPKVKPCNISTWFRKLRKENNLPPLTARSFRHWVATKCDRAGMSKSCRANLLGHDPLTTRLIRRLRGV